MADLARIAPVYRNAALIACHYVGVGLCQSHGARLAALVLGSCSSMQRELSDDEWCKSFEYRAGTREYADCRQRIDRQRARAAEAR
jgi:hypothetical protein